MAALTAVRVPAPVPCQTYFGKIVCKLADLTGGLPLASCFQPGSGETHDSRGTHRGDRPARPEFALGDG
jgi:hypothetical protein